MGDPELNMQPEISNTNNHIYNDVCNFWFNESVPVEKLEETFARAKLAIESLQGVNRVRAANCYRLDKSSRTCVINVTSSIGSDLARVFMNLAVKDYGSEFRWGAYPRREAILEL